MPRAGGMLKFRIDRHIRPCKNWRAWWEKCIPVSNDLSLKSKFKQYCSYFLNWGLELEDLAYLKAEANKTTGELVLGWLLLFKFKRNHLCLIHFSDLSNLRKGNRLLLSIKLSGQEIMHNHVSYIKTTLCAKVELNWNYLDFKDKSSLLPFLHQALQYCNVYIKPAGTLYFCSSSGISGTSSSASKNTSSSSPPSSSTSLSSSLSTSYRVVQSVKQI